MGKLWIPKLFDGEHSLIINKIDERSVLFIQKELFSGLLVPFLRNMAVNTESGFEIMNHELKKEAERRMK